jgi:hypothetical protein
MAKSIIRFSFPGNIVWGDTIKDNWAKMLLEYVERELEIGNGTFMNMEPCLTKNITTCPTINGYTPKQIIVEIICEMPEAFADDEFAIRARLITLLENREIDFIKFHNCGVSKAITVTMDEQSLASTKSSNF